jgi:chromosome segregation ATPase
MMILNLTTIAACFLMLFLFRRLDNANARMAKLRRYSAKIFDDFRKLTEKESRKFQDATIEIDILIKKSNALAKNMAESIGDIENRIKGLDVEKSNLKKVEEDIRVISAAAKDVNKQIQFIGSARENFGDITGKLAFLSEGIENMNERMNQMVSSFEEKLRDRSRDISNEFYVFAENMKNDLERRETELAQSSRERILQLSDELSKSMTEMETRFTESGELLHDNFRMKLNPLIKTVEKAESLNTQLNNLRDTFAGMEATFFDDFNRKSTELGQKLRAVETNMEESKTKLVSSFEYEVNRVRTEVDNLSIHAVTKKDEIVQATRREAEMIRKKMDEFEDKFIQLENRLVETADNKLSSMDSEYQAIDLRLSSMLGRIRDDEHQLENRLSEIKNEIIRYEQHNDVFGKVDTLIKTLEDAKREARDLEKFIADIEQIKELKKNAEREIRAFISKKEKLADMEGEVRNLAEVNDLVISKSDRLLESVSRIDAVNSRIDGLSEAYNALERRINELHEYEEVITRNLDSVSKSDIIIQSIDSRIKSFEKVMERSDRRVDKITSSLKRIEEETLILKTKESDIQELKDRLSELDGLSDHMEERVKQIYAMFQKIETVRKEIDSTDNKLQEMFSQTDRKMKEFSDFIQAVDNNNPILKQVKGDIKNMPGRNLNDNVVKTVRELSVKGWDPEAISKKLMIDENSVRFIINTTLL